MLNLQNPVAAVTQANPYSYYADLVTRNSIYYDEAIKMWVASSADAVTSVLTNDLCRVRPANEPVPKVLLDSPAAEIFRHLIRMNDGENLCPLKEVVTVTLESINSNKVNEESRKWAQRLSDESKPAADFGKLSDFAFRLPVYVVARLLGVSPDKLHQTAIWTGEFVGCLAPNGSAKQIEAGKLAASRLLDLFRSLLHQRTAQDESLIFALMKKAKSIGVENNDIIVANGIGFLSQTYEATAGLIGNTLLALSIRGDVRQQIKAEPSLLANVIEEVVRYDPPIQNTRRFVVRDGIVVGQKMKAGDAILVVLAAANRDPSVNLRPEQFDIFRKNRRSFTFGVGVHACPGQKLAAAIARSGVEQLLESGIEVESLLKKVSYRNSANSRIPLFSN